MSNATKKLFKTNNQFEKEIQKDPISRVWKGYNTYLFLEIGPLHTEKYNSPKGIKTYSYGKYTIEISGHWEIFKNKERILQSKDAKLDTLESEAQMLKDQQIVEIDINETLTKATIIFTNQLVMYVNALSTAQLLLAFSQNYPQKQWMTIENGSMRYENKIH